MQPICVPSAWQKGLVCSRCLVNVEFVKKKKMKHINYAILKGGGNPKLVPVMAKAKGTDVNLRHQDPDWLQTCSGCGQVPSFLCTSISLFDKMGVIKDGNVSMTTWWVNGDKKVWVVKYHFQVVDGKKGSWVISINLPWPCCLSEPRWGSPS